MNGSDTPKSAMGLRSMTGFASVEGNACGIAWRWELRSVNARGLDFKLRLAEGWESLEPALRRMAQARLKRGGVGATLRLSAERGSDGPALDTRALETAADWVGAAVAAAQARGLPTAPVAPEALLRLPGVLDRHPTTPDPEARSTIAEAMTRDFSAALDALDTARAAEGGALAARCLDILDQFGTHLAEAQTAHGAQVAAAPDTLRQRVEALLGAGAGADPDRLAQELALLAIRLDIREEIDRLHGHVGAARALLAGPGPAGRQLDFLAQEFNREVNTLCAKSDSPALTQAGLAMKILVDQIREQAQNIE